jgi:adenine phosphoribosyltransferase
MVPTRPTYAVEVAGLRRELPLFEVAPGVRIAVLNILGDTELVEACARALAERLARVEFDLIITPEAKSIPLAHALARVSGRGYIVLRKVRKVYMGDTLDVETVSITTGIPQTLYLDEKDRDNISGRRVVLLDDVVSTGSTLEGMRALMAKAGATIAAEAAIFTEGDPQRWKAIVALGHLPVFDSG